MQILGDVENGIIQVKNVPTNLKKLMKSCLSIILNECKGKNIVVNGQCTVTEMVSMDKRLLKQVLMIYLLNSVKYTFEGKVKIEIYRDLNNIYFHIWDSGIGIEEKQINYLFNLKKQIL